MQTLDFEQREIVQQVMDAVWPTLTARQATCLRLQLQGRTQKQAAVMLGVSQQAVCDHVKAALRKVKRVSADYL